MSNASNTSSKKNGNPISFSGNAPAAATAIATQPAAATAEPRVTQDAIARAAYFRWQKQGGDAYTNWCEAEKELRAAAAAAKSTPPRK